MKSIIKLYKSIGKAFERDAREEEFNAQLATSKNLSLYTREGEKIFRTHRYTLDNIRITVNFTQKDVIISVEVREIKRFLFVPYKGHWISYGKDIKLPL